MTCHGGILVEETCIELGSNAIDLSSQEEAMRARARKAMEDTKRANEVLQSFKQLEREREEQMDAAIKGAFASCCSLTLCHDMLQDS